MEVFYKKQKPTIIIYSSYKHFFNEVSMADDQNRISQVTSENIKGGIDWKACNKKCYLCVGLIRRKNKNFVNDISTRGITDNKTFWKTVKSLFTEKAQTKSKITFIEKKG